MKRRPDRSSVYPLLHRLYGDPHGIGISDTLARKKFGHVAVDKARATGLVKAYDGVLRIAPAGLRALARV